MDAESEFWARAIRGLPWFRFLRCPLRLEQLDRELLGTGVEEDWLRLRAQVRPGDELWPFTFNARPYLGLRSGYLLLRQGRPVGGVVTVVS